MSALSLQPSFIYGLNSHTKQNAVFVSDSEILYPAGGVLVLQTLKDIAGEPAQKYIHLRDKQRPLDVICINPKKDLVAVGEGGEKPAVSLYSLDSRQLVCTLKGFPPEIESKCLACLRFSCDGNYVVAVTGEPDWMLLCFSVPTRALDSKTRANMAAQPDGEVAQISCNPVDPSTLSVVGPGLFRLLQLVDGSWRQFGFHKAQKFPLRSVCWLTSDRLLAGTEDGRILLVESNELRAVFKAADLKLVHIPSKDSEAVSDEDPGPARQCVTSIMAHANGFLLGLGNPCTVVSYKHEGGARYSRESIYTLPPAPHKDDASDPKSEEAASVVWWLDVSPTCDLLLTSTIQVQLYIAPLSKVEGDGDKRFLVPLGEPLHRGMVACLSMCVWRPVFASCGLQDNSVRVWNYDTGKQELMKIFGAQPRCVSMHPLGLFLLVGFTHSVCLLAVQLDDLVSVRELAVRGGCNDCQFSPGGQLFAVAHASKVEIVSAITFEILRSLQGHCAQVEGMCWTPDNSHLVTCGSDGAVYEWEVSTGRRVEELVTKGTFYQDVATIGAGKIVYVVAGDLNIREIHKSQLVRLVECETSKRVTAEAQLSVALPVRGGRVLLLASRCGAVMVTTLPLGEETSIRATGACMHSAPITRVSVSHDGTKVVSCSEDGSICVWDLQQPITQENQNGKKTLLTLREEQVLVGRVELTRLSCLLRALQERLEAQQSERAEALEHQAALWQEKLDKIAIGHQERERELVIAIEVAAEKQKLELERACEEKTAIQKDNEVKFAAQEDSYEARLLVEYRKVEELEKQLAEQAEKNQRQSTEIEESHCQTLNETCRIYDEKIIALENNIKQLQVEQERLTTAHAEEMRRLEEEVDREVVDLQVKHEEILKVERARVDRLGGQAQSATNKYLGCKQEINTLHERCNELQDEIKHHKGTIDGLERHIAEQRRLMERNNSILENKERKLGDVTLRVSELMKEKETLGFRMDMLARQAEPREQLLQHKMQELDQIGRELKEERRARSLLSVELSSSTAQLRQAQKNLTSAQNKCRDSGRDMSRLRARVHQLGEVLQQPRNLARLSAELYRDWGRNGEVAEEAKRAETAQELRRQLEALRDLNAALMNKLKNLEETHRTEKNALKQECVLLMKEIERTRNSVRGQDTKTWDEYEEN